MLLDLVATPKQFQAPIQSSINVEVELTGTVTPFSRFHKRVELWDKLDSNWKQLRHLVVKQMLKGGFLWKSIFESIRQSLGR